MTSRVFGILLFVLLAGACAHVSPEAAAESSSALAATEPAALRPLVRERRLVVMLVDNVGSETTDVLVPHGILKRSNAVDVLIVATEDGPVELMPALTIMPDMTVSEFEEEYPHGADAVAVPAFHSRGTEATSDFLLKQAEQGAMIVSICEGSEPVARAGLFDGRSATTHWFARNRMLRRYPDARWVENVRYVVDGQVMSSSGVSASVPVTLALLEILAGPESARVTADNLGVVEWSSEHDSSRFDLDVRAVASALGNVARFWERERLYIDVTDGMDGIALALQSDAWSRTYRSRLIARNPSGAAISTEGVRFLTEKDLSSTSVLTPVAGGPIEVLDTTLGAISERYGETTARLVALQLEYAWPADPTRNHRNSANRHAETDTIFDVSSAGSAIP